MMDLNFNADLTLMSPWPLAVLAGLVLLLIAVIVLAIRVVILGRVLARTRVDAAATLAAALDGDELTFDGENRDEVLEVFRAHDVAYWTGDDGFGTDYGYHRDPVTELPVGEPAINAGDVILAAGHVVSVIRMPADPEEVQAAAMERILATIGRCQQCAMMPAPTDRCGSCKGRAKRYAVAALNAS